MGCVLENNVAIGGSYCGCGVVVAIMVNSSSYDDDDSNSCGA